MADDKGARRRAGAKTWPGRAFIRTVVCCVLAAAAALCYLQVVGFPRWARDRLMQRLSTPAFSVEADAVSFNIFSGLKASPVKVYRKRIVGPPVLAAETVNLLIDPVTVFAGRPRVSRIRIEGAELCPEMMGGRRRGPTDDEAGEDRDTGRPRSLDTHRVFPDLELIDCRLDEVVIKLLRCRLSVNGPLWSVTDVRASIAHGEREGSLTGEGAYDAAERMVEGKFAARMNPEILMPCFDVWHMPGTARLVRRFDFGDSVPRCEVEFSRVLEPGGSFRSNGRIWIEDSVYRGVDAERADATVGIRIEEDHLFFSLDPLYVTRPEGGSRAAIEYDGKRRDVVFKGNSTVDLRALTGMIGILTNSALDMLDFEGAAFARGGGLVALKERLKTDFKVDVDSKRIGLKTLVAEDCSFTVRMKGATNRIENFSSDLYDGRLTGDAAFFLDPVSFSNMGYEVSLAFDDIACTNFNRMAGQTYRGKFKGKLSGSVKVTGPSGPDIFQTMTGSGSVGITDGRVFSLPLFGGFSRIMTRIIPGLDFVLRQTDANASFTIADGRIHSDEIHIKGDVLSLSGRGSYFFDGDLDFTVRVSLMREHTLVARLIAPLVYPISKLFEFRLRGTIDNPDWYPVNFSKEMLQRIGLARKDEDSD